jgi:hypothetical protein
MANWTELDPRPNVFEHWLIGLGGTRHVRDHFAQIGHRCRRRLVPIVDQLPKGHENRRVVRVGFSVEVDVGYGVNIGVGVGVKSRTERSRSRAWRSSLERG